MTLLMEREARSNQEVTLQTADCFQSCSGGGKGAGFFDADNSRLVGSGVSCQPAGIGLLERMIDSRSITASGTLSACNRYYYHQFEDYSSNSTLFRMAFVPTR